MLDKIYSIEFSNYDEKGVLKSFSNPTFMFQKIEDTSG